MRGIILLLWFGSGRWIWLFMDSLPPDSTSARLGDAQPNGHRKSASVPDLSGGASQPVTSKQSIEAAN